MKDRRTLVTAFKFTGNHCLPENDRQGLAAFSDNPFMEFEEEEEIDIAGTAFGEDVFEYSMEMSREFRGLRIWLPLQFLGVNAFRDQLDDKLSLTDWAWHELEEIPHIHIVTPPQLSVIPFRLHVEDATLDELNDLNRRLLDSIHERGNAALSKFVVKGAFCLRMAILNHRTTREHVRQAIEDIQVAAQEIVNRVL